MMALRTNLLDLDPGQLVEYCESLDEKPFRARQLQRWIHQLGVGDFDRMTNLARSLRTKLADCALVAAPQVLASRTSGDGTRKWLLDVGNGDVIETVFIPEESRGTLCISTQAGCMINCLICATGKQGFSRNLTLAEIIGQLWMAEFYLRKTNQASGANQTEDQPQRQISNVVLMGMGEPLLNYDTCISALKLMLDDYGYGLSRRRVTVSTSGVVPMMDRLAQECPVALAVSLHAPTDGLRDRLVPLNRRYPLAQLMDACRRYARHAPRGMVMFEYCMIDGVNDTDEHARQLVDLVRKGPFPVPCKLNLIPFNPFAGTVLRRSTEEQLRSFQKILQDSGILTTVRKTRGDDIDAACGLLSGEVQGKADLQHRLSQITVCYQDQDQDVESQSHHA